jgi:hypothetical protein
LLHYNVNNSKLQQNRPTDDWVSYKIEGYLNGWTDRHIMVGQIEKRWKGRWMDRWPDRRSARMYQRQADI